MLDKSGLLVGQPVPAEPVFIKDENSGKVVGFPSVATVLIADVIMHNIVAMVRNAVRIDVIALLERCGLVPEGVDLNAPPPSADGPAPPPAEE